MKKKLLVFLAAAALLLALVSCGKSEAAKAVDEQIGAIGTVTLDSESAIAAAEAALAGLSEDDAKQVDGKETLTAARAAYEQLVLESAAKEISDAIAAIGAVTLDSGAAIDAAQAAFDAAPAEVQALVANAGDLAAAKESLSGLRVNEVSGLISAIGAVSMDSKDAIDAAQTAYDALSPADQAKVANAGDLSAAAEKLKELKKAEGAKLLAGMRLEEDRVRGLKFYYPSAFRFFSDGSWDAATRCFVLPYLGQEGDRAWVRLLFNYTGDDWVFFKKVTVVADEQRFYKFFNYFDIVRDNGGGDVWEYIDTDGSSDIEMLWAIANSAETIVRFEGDDYSHDFTVKASDKEAIRAVLTAYEALA